MTLFLLLACGTLPLVAGEARAQQEEASRLGEAAIGGGLGVVAGAALTLSLVVARAQLQEQYLDSAHDLIHWQTTPMIAGPATGVFFGLQGEEVLTSSVIGSLYGFVAGTAIGSGVGWLASAQPESPWAGGVIGAGLGLSLGGFIGGLRAWKDDDDDSPDPIPALTLGVRIGL